MAAAGRKEEEEAAAAMEIPKAKRATIPRTTPSGTTREGKGKSSQGAMKYWVMWGWGLLDGWWNARIENTTDGWRSRW
jgi:hypothetical protein